jgi:hypothetical protein
MIGLLNARVRSSQSSQSLDDAEESASNIDRGTDAPDLIDAPAADSTNNSSSQPSNANNTNDASPGNVQNNEENAHPPAEEETNMEHNNEGGRVNNNDAGADGGSNPTDANTTNGGNAVDNPVGGAGGASGGGANSFSQESDQPWDAEEEDEPNRPNQTNQNIGWDAGLEVSNADFNAAHNLQSFDVGYRVIENDLRLQELSLADWKLLGVYGDTIHHNVGIHLDGGIEDNITWQKRWRRVVSTPISLWFALKGRIGRTFVEMWTKEWRGVRERRWNSEKAILFATCMLRRKSTVRSASGIKATIEARLKLWDAG